MRKVELRMNEQEKYEVIKKLVETKVGGKLEIFPKSLPLLRDSVGFAARGKRGTIAPCIAGRQTGRWAQFF